MTTKKVALAVIADGNAKADGFERMLKSVKGKVDGIFVGLTSTQDGFSPESSADLLDWMADLIAATVDEGNVRPIGWYEDFARARNESFKMVYDHVKIHADVDFDYIFWLDCDDVLPEDFDIQAAIAEMERDKSHFALINYDYQIEGDLVLASHYKERLFRADWSWEWIFPIHENCVGPIGTRVTRLPSDRFTIHHRRGESTPKRERNKEMIRAWYKNNPEEPRAVMFMAHQTLAMAEDAKTSDERDLLLKTALRYYRQFMGMTDHDDDDAYTSNSIVADILRQLGRHEDSINIDLQGIKMRPFWPSSYVSIGETHYAAGSYQDAHDWAELALSLKFDQDKLQINDRLEERYKPLMLRAAAALAMGRFDEALSSFESAAEILDDDYTQGRIEAVKRMRAAAAERDLKPEATSRQERWGSQPERSIAFIVPPTAEPWNPEIMDSAGMGGTERTVIKLAQQFAAIGWRVAIFGNPGSWHGRVQESPAERLDAAEMVGTVEWHSIADFHPDEPFKVGVVLRDPQLLDTPFNAQIKILWMHDLTVGDARYSSKGDDRFSVADAIVCPSEFHLRHLMKVYGDKPWTARNCAIVNGVDREPFLPPSSSGDEIQRDPLKVVYASSPDRGLTRLLDLWPAIADANPGVSLDIYYGWDSIDAIVAAGLPQSPMLAYFKQKTLAQIERLKVAGYAIAERGRVSEGDLAYAFLRAGVMAYPANFQETFGIVFAQALTAGVMPVVPNLGALPRMCKEMHIVYGSPDSMEFGDRFVEAMTKALQETTEEDRARLALYTENMAWSDVILGWQQLIAESEVA